MTDKFKNWSSEFLFQILSFLPWENQSSLDFSFKFPMRKDIHAQYSLQTEKCSVLKLTQIKFSISYFKKNAFQILNN